MAKSIQTQVYEELRRNILSLHLKPGQTMSTQEIATKLNVSRTPVREAFLKLQEQGLVEMIPQKETTVSKINLKRANQEKFLRESLELGIVRKFMEHGTSEIKEQTIFNMMANITKQRNCVKDRDFVSFLNADDTFHSLLFAAVEETMSWDIIKQQCGHYDRMRILFVQDEAAAKSSIEQHENIVRLLEKNDQKNAIDAMLHHIRRPEFDDSRITNEYPEYFQQDDSDKNEFRLGTL